MSAVQILKRGSVCEKHTHFHSPAPVIDSRVEPACLWRADNLNFTSQHYRQQHLVLRVRQYTSYPGRRHHQLREWHALNTDNHDHPQSGKRLAESDDFRQRQQLHVGRRFPESLYRCGNLHRHDLHRQFGSQ